MIKNWPVAEYCTPAQCVNRSSYTVDCTTFRQSYMMRICPVNMLKFTLTVYLFSEEQATFWFHRFSHSRPMVRPRLWTLVYLATCLHNMILGDWRTEGELFLGPVSLRDMLSCAGETTVFGVRQAAVEHWLYHVSVRWPWTGYFTSLRLCFFIHQEEREKTLLHTSKNLWKT